MRRRRRRQWTPAGCLHDQLSTLCLHQMECFIPRRQAERQPAVQGGGSQRQPVAASSRQRQWQHKPTAHPGLQDVAEQWIRRQRSSAGSSSPVAVMKRRRIDPANREAPLQAQMLSKDLRKCVAPPSRRRTLLRTSHACSCALTRHQLRTRGCVGLPWRQAECRERQRCRAGLQPWPR